MSKSLALLSLIFTLLGCDLLTNNPAGEGEACLDKTDCKTGFECIDKVCKATCVPSCEGKCAGGDDGCNGTCADNTCSGCCTSEKLCKTGAEDVFCGLEGKSCINCSQVGKACKQGQCSLSSDASSDIGGLDQSADGSSTPTGANDTGFVPPSGICDATTCRGCCAGNYCFSGQDGRLCGQGGVACQACSSTSPPCPPGQTCPTDCKPDCSNKCLGNPDGCGGFCTQNTCAGCCDSAMQCRPGNDLNSCGKPGSYCRLCQPNWHCTEGECQSTCVPNCRGKCQGAPDGCGGQCSLSDCPGCCDAANVCQPGTINTSCGTLGNRCVGCGDYNACAGGRCTPFCVPNCEGKCLGADNGCGQPCTVSQCAGCCDAQNVCRSVSSQYYCGLSNTVCKTCTDDQFCNQGNCQAACVPSCAGKCAGQDDGCGKPCNVNDCQGCCTLDSQCQAGTSIASCGKGGAYCQNCPQNHTCSASQCSCTPQCANKCEGMDDSCGGFCTGACTRGYISKDNKIQPVDYAPGQASLTPCKLVGVQAGCGLAPTPQFSGASGQCSNGGGGYTIYNQAWCDCRANDNNLTYCNSSLGCAYYSCSNQCHPVGTSSCTAGCGC